MKKILSILLSVVLLVSMLPISSYGRTETDQKVENLQVASKEIQKYSNTGTIGTYNNPIVMYVGDSINLDTNVKNRGVFKKIATRWTKNVAQGSEVVTYDENILQAAKRQNTTVKATSIGIARVYMEWKNWTTGENWESAGETDQYFYITVIEKPQNVGNDQVGNMKLNKTAQWADYNNGIAKITLNASYTESIQGSDVIIMLDKSSSMKKNWGAAHTAAKEMAQTLLSNPIYNNRVAFVSFAGDVGGSFNFKTDLNTTINGMNNISILTDDEANGTNYSLAFQQAINYAQSREDSKRPLHVVFLSDGEATNGNKGKSQAIVLKDMATSEHAVGIGLKNNSLAARDMKQLFGTANYLATTSEQLNATLKQLLTVVAEKHLGTVLDANIVDTIATKYSLVDGDPLYVKSPEVIFSTDHTGNPANVQVLMNEMKPDQTYSYIYYIKINEDLRVTNAKYAVGTNLMLTYHATGLSDLQKITASNPKLQTKTGSITVEYRLDQTNELVYTEKMDKLAIQSDPYQVSPIAPRGYELVNDHPSSHVITYKKNNKTVVYKVHKLEERFVNYRGMQGASSIEDPDIYYPKDIVTVKGDYQTFAMINNIRYQLQGWTEDETKTTDERVLISSKEELDQFDLIYPGDMIEMAEENLTLYAVWAPATIHDSFHVIWMNETEEFKPDSYDYNYDYTYGEGLHTFTDVPSKPETIAERYNFLGWTLGEKDDQGNDVLVDVSKVVVNKNLELKAVYGTEIKNYSVRILNADGSVLFDESMPYGSTVFMKNAPNAPESMQETGYVVSFQKWINQETEESVQLDNIEQPVKVGGDIVYKAVFVKGPRTDLSFRINFVNASGIQIAPAYEMRGTAVFGQTYEITNAMLPSNLTGYAARTTNPQTIKISNLENNQINYVYDLVSAPVTPVAPATPAAPAAPAAPTVRPVVRPAVTPVTPVAPVQNPVVIPTPQTPQAETPVVVTPETPKADKPAVNIDDKETPKAESALSWAFMNLIMMVLTIFASVAVWVMFGVGKKKQNQAGTTRKMMFSMCSLLPAIVSVIAFLITENMMNPMVIADKWTVMMVLIAVVQAVVVVFGLKKTNEIQEMVEK